MHCAHSFIIFALSVGTKKMSAKDSGEKKEIMSVEVKQEIMEKYECGM